MEYVSGYPNNLRLGSRATDDSRPRGTAVARHSHVGDPVFLERGIRRRELCPKSHPSTPRGAPATPHPNVGLPQVFLVSVHWKPSIPANGQNSADVPHAAAGVHRIRIWT